MSSGSEYQHGRVSCGSEVGRPLNGNCVEQRRLELLHSLRHFLRVQRNVSECLLFTKLQTLAGFRFLIVEDEMVQAQRLSMLIAEMGGSIANISYGFQQARQAIDDTAFDCAILDVNLSGTLAFQLAEALDRKHIPFVYCTAYADAIDVYPGASRAPRVDKPVQAGQLRDALLTVLKVREIPSPLSAREPHAVG